MLLKTETNIVVAPTYINHLTIALESDHLAYFTFAAHEFDGLTRKCDNLANNFWDNPTPNVRYATVVLRRKLTAKKAGIFTGTSCGIPTYKIKDIYVFF